MQDRQIHIGDTVVELTEREVRFGAVEYLYNPGFDMPVQWRLASPEEILQSTIPEVMFQVTEEGYEVLVAKAKRLQQLRAKHA